MKDTFVLCKDWISYTNEMSNEDKGILLDVIMKYQNGIDIGDPPYAIKIVFAHIKTFFISQDEKYKEKILKRNQENGQKGGRPTKKKPKKPTGLKNNPSEPKETLTETDTVNTLTTDVVNDNISNDILLKEKQEQKKFGNEEINEMIEIIKQYNDGVIDGSDGRQRQFAKNLIGKIKKIKSVEEGKFTRQQILNTILSIVKDDPYYNTKISSPELIFYNLASLMQVCRTKIKKDSGPKEF